MAEDPGKLTTLVAREVAACLTLVGGLRLAFRPQALILAAVAWVAVVAGWRVCGSVYSHALSPTADSRLAETIAQMTDWPWSQHPPLATLPQPDEPVGAGVLLWWRASPLVQGHVRLAAPFFRLFDPQITAGEFCFLLTCGLWELVIWAFFGGAITRLATVALAREESTSWTDLLRHARDKGPSHLAAPLYAIFGTLAAAIPLVLFGLLLAQRLGLGDRRSLLVCAAHGRALHRGAAGWVVLRFSADVAHNQHRRDRRLRRSEPLVCLYLREPLLYALYAAMAAALGILGWLVVLLFTSTIVDVGAWGVSWCGGGRIAPEVLTGLPWRGLLGDGSSARALGTEATGPTAELGLWLIRCWIGATVTLATAFVFSYFWTANTAIYLLLRRQIDSVALDQVYFADEDEPSLPTLTRESTGGAEVADVMTHANGAPAKLPASSGSQV